MEDFQEKKKYCLWPQLYASLSVSICGLCTGTFFAYNSVALPLLQKPVEQGGWQISLEAGSWVVGMLFVGSIIGTALAGLLIHWLGSRRVCRVSASVIVLAWLCLSMAPNLAIVLLARLVSGICYGLVLSVVKVYNAEVSHPEIRGFTSTFYPILIPTGTIYCYTVGYFLQDWRQIAGCCMAPAMLFLLLTLWMPESPYWLIEQGRVEEALDSLQWLRGPDINVKNEFDEIRAKKECRTDISRISSLLTPAFLRPLVIVGVLVLLVDMSGIKTVSQYMVYIFEQSGSSIDPTLAPVIVAAVQTVIGCCGGLVLRYSPRRPLFLLCCFVVGLSQITLGTYTYLQSRNPDLQLSFGWVPLAALIGILASESIGFLSIIHFNLQAESFRSEHRAFGCAASGIISQFALILMAKLFPQLLSQLGFSGAFYYFSAVIAIIMLYGYILLPENKGQSLVRTEDKLEGNNKNIS